MEMTDTRNLKAGDVVGISHYRARTANHVTRANVVRVTKTMVIVQEDGFEIDYFFQHQQRTTARRRQTDLPIPSVGANRAQGAQSRPCAPDSLGKGKITAHAHRRT